MRHFMWLCFRTSLLYTACLVTLEAFDPGSHPWRLFRIDMTPSLRGLTKTTCHLKDLQRPGSTTKVSAKSKTSASADCCSHYYVSH